jgi:integrase/recombinase XerD
VDATAQAWVAGLRASSPHTARSYAEAVERFLAHVSKPVEAITVQDALAYVGELSQSGLSRASVAHHVSAVRSFLRHCQGLGILPTSPLDALRRPRVAIMSMNRYLTQEEAERLLVGARQVSPQAYLAIAILLLTGLRVAELATAEWRHVFRDPQGNVGLLVVNGKGGKERVVAVRPDLWEAIRADRLHRGLSSELDARDRTPLVADRRATPYTSAGLWKVVRAATTRAGLDKPISPHWLRHTFGTLAALGGASPFQLQADMGHSQITTSQRYVHWARGLADSAAHLVGIHLTTTTRPPE